MPPDLDAAEIESLRRTHYNAVVTDMNRMHDDLFVLRLKPDGGIPPFSPGQYTSLGLGYWETRQQPCQDEQLPEGFERRLVKRAYSIGACVFAPGTRRLIEPEEEDFLEFFVAVVRYSDEDTEAPALTTRLVRLEPGDRMWVGAKVVGLFTLELARQRENFLFCATGTGEAPHDRMIWSLLRNGFDGRLVNVTCARTRSDLAYREIHEELMRRHPDYLYVPLTTRESTGGRKVYIQDLIESGELSDRLGEPLDPSRWDVFLCGNPSMIGVPKEEDGRRVYPRPKGVVEVLETRFGFEADARRVRGNLHFETFW